MRKNALFVYLTCIVILLSCSKMEEEDHLNDKSAKISYNEGNNQISYIANVENNILDMKLVIENRSKSIFFNESLKIDLSNENLIADAITEHAIKLSEKYSLQTIDELSSLISKTLNSKFNSMPKDELSKMENQGLIMFYSLLKTIRRKITYDLSKLKNKKPFLSTVSDGFKTKESSFIFNEDIGINVQNLISSIENNQHSLSEEENSMALYVLGCFDEEIISLQDLRDKVELLDIEEESSTLKRWWGRNGGDWGCCGNYEGRCRFRHLICFIHDARCKYCAYWHCGWACVEDEQQAHTEEPIEYLEYENDGKAGEKIFIL